MISRVAEHCFWMSRYLERSENTARVLEVNYTLLLDFHVPMEQQWKPLLIISGIHEYKDSHTAQGIQDFMTWSLDNPFSIISSLNWARENARIIREVISVEMWERINYYYLWIQSDDARAIYSTNRSEFYNQVKRINQLISGISDATMSHGEAWEFFRLGKYLERTGQTARILDVKYHMLLPRVEDVGSPVDNAHWTAILMSCSGYEPFHKKPRSGTLDIGLSVAEFLIFDELFPRSIRRCLMECRKSCEAISEDPMENPVNEADIKLATLYHWLDTHEIETIINEGLHESLTHVVNSIHEIGVAIHSTYFDGSIALRELTAPTQQAQNFAGTQTQTQTQS